MGELSLINDGWTFGLLPEATAVQQMQPGRPVHLPHTAVETPFNYFDEAVFHQPFLYQRMLDWEARFGGKEVSLVFDGAMADAKVYLNGQLLAQHGDGYTPFEVRLTDRLDEGPNLVSVIVDGSENPDIPPFGGQIDYLTYAGIYRDVWLKVTPKIAIDRLKVETFDVLEPAASASVQVYIRNPQDLVVEGRLVARLIGPNGQDLAQAETTAAEGGAILRFDGLRNLRRWTLAAPALYRVEVTLTTDQGGDRMEVTFGFRTAEFTPDGFFLNGKRVKLRGLNRHQSFPYMGYALGKRAQERDAEILKNQLACNIVRSSHYPPSPHFLDHCDRIGLLVITELPGWQHIGGAAWKKASLANVKTMIRRDWNHPSIVMWGVRINESADDHNFYAETNRLSRSLDPSRQTGGVRCIENSEMLEDVYTMNDFHLGTTPAMRGNQPEAALRPQQHVTGLARNVPYLVTECNGHMYPTKRFDQEERLAEHVTRHLQVLDAAYGDDTVSGVIAWCMADYNTHRDFGSGDRVCYHGVLDMYREPKFAAFAYASQRPPAEGPVLKPVTQWARGERSIGGILPLIVLTNCDYVAFQYGKHPARLIYPDRETYPNLPHPPVIIDERTVAPEETGAWGMQWQDGYFIGFVDGKPVAQLRLSGNPQPARLEMAADDAALDPVPGDTTRIAIRALDQCGQVLPFLNEIVSVDIDGPAEIMGPDVLTLTGGVVALWIRTTGAPGSVTVRAFGQRLGVTDLTVQVG